MASCTTNCLDPVARVLHESFGVEFIMFTTVHAYTSSQSLMDTPARHRRRGRAAALSIIPTTTGAAKAAEKVLPQLKGKMTGMAMRVPVPNGSVTDMMVCLGKDVTSKQVNAPCRGHRENAPSRDTAGDGRGAGLPGYHRIS
jgi:glyceraldehyde 3-phosphate dehydrogenase